MHDRHTHNIRAHNRGPRAKHNERLINASRYSREFLPLNPSKGYRVCSVARMRAQVKMALRGPLEIHDAFYLHAAGVAESISHLTLR